MRKGLIEWVQRHFGITLTEYRKTYNGATRSKFFGCYQTGKNPHKANEPVRVGGIGSLDLA